MSTSVQHDPRQHEDAPTLHHLPARLGNCHWGYFDAGLAPALSVRSGDFVRAETVTHHAGDAPDLLMDDGTKALYDGIPPEDRTPGVHLLTGPVLVEGAEPGDMLEIRYLQLAPRLPYGSNVAANWGYLYKELREKERVTIYGYDANSQTVEALFAFDLARKYLTPGFVTPADPASRQPALAGIRIPANLHIGTAGVAPAAEGRVSTVPPGRHGGNVDNLRLGAGTTAWYPIQVKGALFSLGDAHLAMGDGELSGTGIEASVDVLFQVFLRKNFHFPSPVIETDDHWYVHGFGDDLDAAMRDTSIQTLRFLTEHHRLSRDDAYSLMSIAVDFSVTQVVDGTLGVHAGIPRHIFPAGRPHPFAPS
jgi:acetamidase/formamidase